MTEMDAFLASVERRAYVMARSMTGDPDESLDVVQDAMLRFVGGYGRRPSAEWRPLFFRILINRVRDWQRRQTVRGRFMSWLRPEDRDPIETAAAPPGTRPPEVLMAEETLEAIDAGLRALPPRQREAFALRCLEGMDVAATARAMGCSQGSVKTHYSRALAALRRRLGEDDDRS